MTDNTPKTDAITPATPLLKEISNDPLKSREEVIICVEALGQKLLSEYNNERLANQGEDAFEHNKLVLTETTIPAMKEMMGNAFEREQRITPRMVSFFMGEDSGCKNHDMVAMAKGHYDGYLAYSPEKKGSDFFRNKYNSEIDKAIAGFQKNGCENSVRDGKVLIETIAPSLHKGNLI